MISSFDRLDCLQQISIISLLNYPLNNFWNFLETILQYKFALIQFQNIYIRNMRRGNFLRPFFDFSEPFLFHRVFRPPMHIRIKDIAPIQYVQTQQPQTANNAHSIFQQFFDNHGIKTETEKEFFRKHYPEKMEPEKLDPYKVLQIDSKATKDQINEAYRKLAIKYHPKNNSSQQAPQMFEKVSKAYQELTQPKPRDLGELSFNSFFEDFDKQMDNFFSPIRLKQGQAKQNPNDSSVNKFEMYEESSYVQNGLDGNKAKVIMEKVCKKDGKTLKIRREEKIKADGSKQIIETIDDGKEVKKKVFNSEKEQKEQKKSIS